MSQGKQRPRNFFTASERSFQAYFTCKDPSEAVKDLIGAEFMVPLFSVSRCQDVTKKSSKWRLRTKRRRFSENFIILNKKSCHLMAFWWRLERKRTRGRGKKNHKFRALMYFQKVFPYDMIEGSQCKSWNTGCPIEVVARDGLSFWL